MNTLIVTTIASIGLVLVAVAPPDAKAGNARTSADQRATDACLSAFVAKIKPDSTVPVHSRIATTGAPVFTGQLGPYVKMDVEMIAGAAGDSKPLATALCEVDRQAIVHTLTMKVNDAEKLARLQARDLLLAATMR